MKKSILLLIIAIMLFCVSCGVKEKSSNQKETETSKKDSIEKNTVVENDEQKDTFSVKAQFLETKNSTMFIIEGSGPTVVNYNSSENKASIENVINGLTSGDMVEIKCGWIAESYPGQTELYDIKKLEDGTMDDIPSDTIKNLREMGWIE